MRPDRLIQLGDGTQITVLHEDRSVLALDKPAGWMLVPTDWIHTGRNLQLALESSIRAGDFWARSRNLRFLRHIHRLDAETSGVLLCVKNPGLVRVYSELFSRRVVEKKYLAVVAGCPQREEWVTALPLTRDPQRAERVVVNRRNGQAAETAFRVLRSGREFSLVEASPITGRTHQIRVHLAAEGHPIVGDLLYGGRMLPGGPADRLGLRAVGVSYRDPFLRQLVRISAPTSDFLRAFGMELTR